MTQVDLRGKTYLYLQKVKEVLKEKRRRVGIESSPSFTDAMMHVMESVDEKKLKVTISQQEINKLLNEEKEKRKGD